jgi:hypothetical protein
MAAITASIDALVLQAVLDPEFDAVPAMHALVDILRDGVAREKERS